MFYCSNLAPVLSFDLADASPTITRSYHYNPFTLIMSILTVDQSFQLPADYP